MNKHVTNKVITNVIDLTEIRNEKKYRLMKLSLK